MQKNHNETQNNHKERKTIEEKGKGNDHKDAKKQQKRHKTTTNGPNDFCWTGNDHKDAVKP